MSKPSPQWLVQEAASLVSLPDVFLRINGMINDQTASLQKIGEVVALDAGLSARLLKVVNSPLYGYSSRISTISRAIAVIGISDFHHLLLSTCAADMFKRIPATLVNMTDFWLHSVYCAVSARQLAKECAVLHGERFFVAGLLHQVGALLIYARMPEQAREVLAQAGGKFWQVAEGERARWGFCYADVGAELARQWRLPDSLCGMIGWHLQPELAGEHRFDATLLHLAYALKNHVLQDGGAMPDETMAALLQQASGVVDLNESAVLAALAAVPAQAEEALRLLEGD